MKHFGLFLILVFLIIGPDPLFVDAEENWTELDSYDELDGQWEGNAISSVKTDVNNRDDTEFESSLNINMIFNYKKGSSIVTSIVKIDFTAFLNDMENLKEMKESGMAKENIWQIFKEMLGTDNTTFDNYCLYFENSDLADEYFASDSRGKFMINKNKDQLLLIYYEPSFILGIGDAGFTKMIFKKTVKYI